MRTSKINTGRQGAQKWPTGSGKGSTPMFLARQLLLNKFFDLITPSMRKVDNGEKKENNVLYSGH